MAIWQYGRGMNAIKLEEKSQFQLDIWPFSPHSSNVGSWESLQIRACATVKR